MSIEHGAITDPNIHEPKGATTASANTAYVADGSGSGSWAKVTLAAMDTATLYADIETKLNDDTIPVTGTTYLSAVIPDVSSAGTVYVPIPQDATVKGARAVISNAVTVANAAISFKNAADASMGSDITIDYTVAAAGTQYSFTATGNNVITGPSYIKVVTDGASTDAAALYLTIELEHVVN